MKLSLAMMLLFSTMNTFAHSGRTDSYGCHTNHSTGEYHCHNSRSSKKELKRQPSSLNTKKIKLKTKK